MLISIDIVNIQMRAAAIVKCVHSSFPKLAQYQAVTIYDGRHDLTVSIFTEQKTLDSRSCCLCYNDRKHSKMKIYCK